MTDLSIVLRFFALSEPRRIDAEFKDFLGEYMDSRNKAYEAEPSLEAEDRGKFEKAVLNSLKVFGPNGLRNPLKKARGSQSLPISEAIMIALADYDPQQITDDTARAIRERFSILCSDAAFEKATSVGTNGKGAIIARVEMAKAAFREVI